MRKEFRDFVMRGKMMDLAIAVILGICVILDHTLDQPLQEERACSCGAGHEGMPAVCDNHTAQSHALPELYLTAVEQPHAARRVKGPAFIFSYGFSR